MGVVLAVVLVFLVVLHAAKLLAVANLAVGVTPTWFWSWLIKVIAAPRSHTGPGDSCGGIFSCPDKRLGLSSAPGRAADRATTEAFHQGRAGERKSLSRPEYVLFRVTLSAASKTRVTAHWRTANGTAVGGKDYVVSVGNF